MSRDDFDDRVARALYKIIECLTRETRGEHLRTNRFLEKILDETGVNPSELLGALARLMDRVSSVRNLYTTTEKHGIHEYNRSPKYILINHVPYWNWKDNSIGLVELHGEQEGERSRLVVYGGGVLWDNIVIDREHSGPGISISGSRMVYGVLNTPLVSLIIRGRIVARIRDVSVFYMDIDGLLSTSLNGLEASIALLKSTIMHEAIINIKPRRIEKNVLRNIIANTKYTMCVGCTYVYTTIFNMFLEINDSLDESIEVATRAPERISQLYNGLKFAWLELSSAYIGKARITVPRNALINLLWFCRPGQVMIIEGEELSCKPSPSLLERLLRYPRNSVVDSVVFIGIEYVDGDEIVIERI